MIAMPCQTIKSAWPDKGKLQLVGDASDVIRAYHQSQLALYRLLTSSIIIECGIIIEATRLKLRHQSDILEVEDGYSQKNNQIPGSFWTLRLPGLDRQ